MIINKIILSPATHLTLKRVPLSKITIAQQTVGIELSLTPFMTSILSAAHKRVNRLYRLWKVCNVARKIASITIITELGYFACCLSHTWRFSIDYLKDNIGTPFLFCSECWNFYDSLSCLVLKVWEPQIIAHHQEGLDSELHKFQNYSTISYIC